MSDQFVVRRVSIFWNGLWWWLRGVRVQDYRQLCRRCGRTGQVHWGLRGCWRFKP